MHVNQDNILVPSPLARETGSIILILKWEGMWAFIMQQ